jgi:hypothetical protein
MIGRSLLASFHDQVLRDAPHMATQQNHSSTSFDVSPAWHSIAVCTCSISDHSALIAAPVKVFPRQPAEIACCTAELQSHQADYQAETNRTITSCEVHNKSCRQLDRMAACPFSATASAASPCSAASTYTSAAPTGVHAKRLDARKLWLESSPN